MSDAERILTAARLWVGTPYRHQASLRGVGVDCLGLIRGVWRDLYRSEPEAPPPYVASWAEDGGRELMVEAARRHLIDLDLREAAPGDVLLYRMRRGGLVKHCGILTEEGLIHAYSGHAVIEASWPHRPSHAFRFPPLPPA